MGASAAYAVVDLRRVRATEERPPSVPVAAEKEPLPTSSFIAFRHTGVDAEYGTVALVPLDDPSGARRFTGITCDRVDATTAGASCLVTERGVLTTFAALALDPAWQTGGLDAAARPAQPHPAVRRRLARGDHGLRERPLLHVRRASRPPPSIRDVDGESFGNLEKFELAIDGRTVAPVDRNIWGVTFVDDQHVLRHRRHRRHDLPRPGRPGRAHPHHRRPGDVECPSLSPDGTRIAFKQAGRPEGQPGWTPAVLDLATGERTVLAGETHNVDDQIEWLDDDTVLYGTAPQRARPASPTCGRSTPTPPPSRSCSSSRPGRLLLFVEGCVRGAFAEWSFADGAAPAGQASASSPSDSR